GGVKKSFDLTFNAPAPGDATIEIVSTDNLTNMCTVTYNGGAPGGVGPGVVGGKATFNGNCPKGGTTMHAVQLQAGKQVTINLISQTPGYDPYLWLYDPNGQLVAQDDDSGGFPN